MMKMANSPGTSSKGMPNVVAGLAAKYGLDADLVHAICEVESSHNPLAIRFEPHFKLSYFPREHASRLGCSYETELNAQATSWGLMQVMGCVARELGFDGWMPELCQDAVGVEYGCKLLQRLYRRYDEEASIIAAYNAGSARKDKSGMYVNQNYVNKVHQVLTRLRALK